jgi:serine/threonine protein kinase
MCTSDRYQDVAIPTWDDWARVQSHSGKWFPKCCKEYTLPVVAWNKKKPTAVFRGGSTGCGVTINTNQRLKAAYLSSITPPDEDGVPYLDAGLSGWNLRPRKLQDEKYLKTIEIDELPFGLSGFLSPAEQCEYKYIIHISGHTAAVRLSLELGMGSVILLVASQWKIWYSDMLIPYEHYVPVAEDLSNLVDQVRWCRKNDEKCQAIAHNARKFYDTYLHRDALLDAMQKILVDMKQAIGIYLYNTITPLELYINSEYSALDFTYPETVKKQIFAVPNTGRTYGLLRGLEWIVRKVITDGNFEAVATLKGEIFQNKLGSVRHMRLAEFPLAVKTTSDPQKIREHIHETYVGTKGINELTKLIPNFAYIFGMYRSRDTYNVVTEYIHGETLYEYIRGKKFVFQEFLFILMQVSLALQVAQNMCGFVHWDLTPWNIILQRIPSSITFDYILGYDQVIKISTSVIPVLIDFGKSHIICDGEHHGFVNMFKFSTIQDTLTVLITSITQILDQQKLSPDDFGSLLRVANFISGTGYHPGTFDSAKSMRQLFHRVHKYTNLIDSDKHELENLRPFDLVKYIMKHTRNSYKFSLGIVKEYRNTMDKGNPKQIFDYILSGNRADRLASYENVFVHLLQCTIPQPTNLLFVYYAAQNFEANLTSVWEDMKHFLEREKIDRRKYEKIYTDTMKFLRKIYTEKIDTYEEQDVVYDVSGRLPSIAYTEETFLIPEKVYELYTMAKADVTDEDLSEYREMVEMILLNRGVYTLRDTHRLYYLKNFAKLLSMDSLNMKVGGADRKTLIHVAEQLYSRNLDMLRKQQPCETVDKYIELYARFM